MKILFSYIQSDCNVHLTISSESMLSSPSFDAFVLQLGPDSLQVVMIRVSETGNIEGKK